MVEAINERGERRCDPRRLMRAELLRHASDVVNASRPLPSSTIDEVSKGERE